VCTRATPRLNVQHPNHLTEKASSSLRSWAVFPPRCANAQYHQATCVAKSHSRALISNLILYIGVFFKFFKRVTWWSFRVSTSFSLLCLILLTHFHKNASFRPNMLNYLNTTFTFDKQTKDNFINRTVQCIGLNTHSFARFRAGCFIGENRGGSSPRTRNTSRLTAISDSSACSTPRRTKQGRRCSHATWSLEKFWAAFQWV